MVHKQAWSIKIIDTFETYQLEKLFQIFYQSLKELLWENKISKYYFEFIQAYASLFAKENIFKMIYIK
jgi:hypothetical protein